MGPILTVLLSLLVFEFLIFIHEFGHYITARIFKVTITEFSLGFGPELLTYESKKTGIKYKLAMFPLGGFVAMVGEDEDSEDPNAFNKKPAWQRFIVTAAGATVNIVAGFLAMIIIVHFSPVGGTVYAGPVADADIAIYDYIDATYRSDDYGLMIGDEIISVNGKRVRIEDELSYQISRYGHEPVDLVVLRDGEKVEISGVRFPTATSQGQVSSMYGAMGALPSCQWIPSEEVAIYIALSSRSSAPSRWARSPAFSAICQSPLARYSCCILR